MLSTDGSMGGVGGSDRKIFTQKASRTYADATAASAAAYFAYPGDITYHTLLYANGSHTAAKVAGTYAMGAGVLAVSGTGTLYPLTSFYYTSTDYEPGSGAWWFRIRAQLYTNDVAPTGNFTFGLYPITRPGGSGGAGLCTYTIGTVVTGSNGATFTAPAADGLHQTVGSDFSLTGVAAHYVIAVVTTATVAASAHIHLAAQLQYHYIP